MRYQSRCLLVDSVRTFEDCQQHPQHQETDQAVVELVVGDRAGLSPPGAKPMWARRRAVKARRRAGVRHEERRDCWPPIEGQHCQGQEAAVASGVPHGAQLPTTIGLHQGVVMGSTIQEQHDQSGRGRQEAYTVWQTYIHLI